MAKDTGKPSMIDGECEPSRLGDVTTLKVVLALLLVGTHGLTWLHGVKGSTTHLVPAVPVFLFLSGYFMMTNYKRSPYPIRFMISRYLKLLPIMIVSLVAMLGLLVLYFGWPMPKRVFVELPQFFITHLTVFQNYVPPGLRALDGDIKNASLWFIEAILILYSTLPLIAFFERRTKGLLAVLCVTSAYFAILFPAYAQSLGGLRELATNLSIPPSDSFHPLVRYMVEVALRVASAAWMFYAGCLARRHQKWLFSPRIGGLLIGSSLTFTLLLYLVGAGNWNHFGSTPPWFFSGYLAAWIIFQKCCLQKLSVPPISIGLYVWHIPVFHAMAYLDLGSLWLATPVVILLAWASLNLIERPTAQLISFLSGSIQMKSFRNL